MSYKQLIEEQRYQIEAGLREVLSQRVIENCFSQHH